MVSRIRVWLGQFVQLLISVACAVNLLGVYMPKPTALNGDSLDPAKGTYIYEW